LPNVGPYIYDVSISGFTRSSIYIYDISSLRVKHWSYIWVGDIPNEERALECITWRRDNS